LLFEVQEFEGFPIFLDVVKRWTVVVEILWVFDTPFGVAEEFGCGFRGCDLIEGQRLAGVRVVEPVEEFGSFGLESTNFFAFGGDAEILIEGLGQCPVVGILVDVSVAEKFLLLFKGMELGEAVEDLLLVFGEAKLFGFDLSSDPRQVFAVGRVRLVKVEEFLLGKPGLPLEEFEAVERGQGHLSLVKVFTRDSRRKLFRVETLPNDEVPEFEELGGF
jgi:hypothetical protein